jgi:hypothetical protein
LVDESKGVKGDYWREVVRPELQSIAEYLKKGGIAINVPDEPGDYTEAGIIQQINLVINALIDLGEKLKDEEKKPTLSIAP